MTKSLKKYKRVSTEWRFILGSKSTFQAEDSEEENKTKNYYLIKCIVRFCKREATMETLQITLRISV